MMRFPRVGIVGCGSITERGILPHLNAMNVPIVALCDSNLDRCHVLGAIYQIDACYSDFEMMLQDESVEAVIALSIGRASSPGATQRPRA